MKLLIIWGDAMSIKSKISTILKGLAITFSSAVLMVSPTFAAMSGTISGDVFCTYNQWNNIVGVWVDVATGTDGWASWSNNGIGGAHWTRTLSQSTTSYTLHIGCGNTTQSWAQTFYATRTASGFYISCAGSNQWNCING